MSENQVHREWSKHIDVRKYFVRDLAEAKVLKLVPCGIKEMVADAPTKSLVYPSFEMHRAEMLGEKFASARVLVRSGGSFWFGRG